MLNSLFSFVIALGVLVFLHEYGHYWVARRCGVKVLQFSVGFGRPIYQWISPKTGVRWTIGWIPLGGFVRMLDERDEASVAEAGSTQGAFNQKSVWQRIAVVSAGPIANLLVAWVLYAFLASVQQQVVPPVVGYVPEGSVAQSMGVQRGDRVEAVNGEHVSSWQDFTWALLNHKLFGDQTELDILRDGSSIKLNGLDPDKIAMEIGPRYVAELGFSPYQNGVLIRELVNNSPAELAGLKVGDKVLSANGVPVVSAQQFTEYVREHADAPIELSIQRSMSIVTIEVTPEKLVDKDGMEMGRIGAGLSVVSLNEGIHRGFFDSVALGLGRVWEISVFSLVALGNMITGDMSWDNLSGPVSIASAAGQSSSLGVLPFLSFMAMVSVSLGILNLLPIPVLDGGHLMYYFAEILRGKPLSDRVVMAGQRIGFMLIGLLTCFALFNDLQRLL